MHELSAALCLVLVLEGLVLFAAPGSWKRLMEHARQLDEHTLRLAGAAMMGIGAVALKIFY